MNSDCGPRESANGKRYEQTVGLTKEGRFCSMPFNETAGSH
jgi:hypothetical protein